MLALGTSAPLVLLLHEVGTGVPLTMGTISQESPLGGILGWSSC